MLCPGELFGMKVKVKVAQSCLPICYTYTVHGFLQARILEWVVFPTFPSPGDLPNPGIEPRSPTLQVDCLPAEPQGKPRNTKVGSLSLLQRIFPTQELNHCLLQLQADSLPTELWGKPHSGRWSSECVPEPDAPTSPELLWEVQGLRLHADLRTHPPWGQDPALSFNKPSGGPEAHWGLRLQFIPANHPNLSLSPSNNRAQPWQALPS